MLARFQIRLPTRVLVLNEELMPEQFALAGMDVRIWPPYRCQVVEGILPGAVPRLLDPAVPPPISEIAVVNGVPAIEADAVQIDFRKEEFDRESMANDPPIELAVGLANSLEPRSAKPYPVPSP